MINLNYLAIFVASIAGFATGAIWFGPKTFFPVWWRAMGRDENETPGGSNMGLVFGLTYLGQLALSFASAIVLSFVFAANSPATTADALGVGLQVGLLLGVLVAAAASLTHRLFAGHGLKVWLLEVGNDIAAIVVMSLILAAWR
jgi:hypothetical protein